MPWTRFLFCADLNRMFDLYCPAGGSSGANPFACIAAGIAALWGPAHGGANEAVLNMLSKSVTAAIPNISKRVTR